EADEGLLVVETGDVLEMLPAGGEECLAAGQADLLQGLEAVGHEGGGDDQEPLDPGSGQPFELPVGEGLEPGLARQPGLERDGIAGRVEPGPGGEGPGGG